MKIVRYDHRLHRHLVERWLSARGIQVPPPEFSSDCGFVVEGKAVGFLYLTNSRMAYLDQVATEPGMPLAQREEILQGLFRHIEQEARRAGAHLLIVLCGSQNMQNRFFREGFNKEGSFTLVHKLLKEAV